MNDIKTTILVVEDNEDIRSSLISALEDEGYHCRQASDGFEALDVLAKFSLPRLILLDLMMPRMNGIELVDHIRKLESELVANIPIIMLTAVSDIGLNHFDKIQKIIKKPVELDDLLEAIRTVLKELKS